MTAAPSSGQQSRGDALPLHPADKRAPVVTRYAMCVRCKTERGTVAVQTSRYCTPCFRHAFESKVRPGMEQARICAFLQQSEDDQRTKPATNSIGRVALALSGGASSRAMLRLAKERLLRTHTTQRKGTRYEVAAIDVLYVEDCVLMEGDEVDRTDVVRQLIEEEGGAAAGLHFVPLRLEEVFEESSAILCASGFKQRRRMADVPIMYESREALLSLFAIIRPRKVTRTALANARSRAEDLHRLLTMHLLRREAVRRGSSCLLTGENATRRAVRTIEGLGRGRGHKMPLEDAPIRWHGVFMLRPMSDVSSKEIAFFLHSIGCEALVPRDLIATELLAEQDDNDVGAAGGVAMTGGSGAKGSMGRLTEALINLLERNVPGTISTVNRTSDKLVFHDGPASHVANLDGASGTSNGLQRVGPSLFLRGRREESVSSGDTTTPETDVRGLGLGGPGAKHYLAAKAWPHYTGDGACPLCQMPAQSGLERWREALTVSGGTAKSAERAWSKQNGETTMTIDLSDLLCYACSHLLDTPESAPIGQTMPLPTYVLRGALTRLHSI